MCNVIKAVVLDDVERKKKQRVREVILDEEGVRKKKRYL